MGRGLLLPFTFLFLLLSSFKHSERSDMHRIHEKLCEEIYIALIEEGIFAEVSGPYPSGSIYIVRITAHAFDRALYTFEEAEAFYDRVEKIILQTVNNNQECRPYLKTFPFKQGVTLHITFFDPWTDEKVSFPKFGLILGCQTGCRAVQFDGEKDIVIDAPALPNEPPKKTVTK